MTKNNEDEDGDLDNKKRKEIKDFAIWFNRTEKQNQEKRKKDLKRKRELEQVCTNPKPWTINWTKSIITFLECSRWIKNEKWTRKIRYAVD